MDQATAAVLLATLVLLNSQTAHLEEDKDTFWDAWGTWSECSRTCGGGASYALRRCLSSKICEGQNIKYRTCSNVDCPMDSGDFRAQQCSAHADVHYQGRYHEWLPVDNDPENPCALKCKAWNTDLVVELAPKVLDGTRCYTESLDMCISGACQIVGCDHELGSTAKEDNCGVCNGDGSSCRLVRGYYKSQHGSGKTEDTVIVIPYGSRHVRLVLKGPDHLYLESKTLQGQKRDLPLDETKQYILENTTIDFQKLSDKEVLRVKGPVQADFTIKVLFDTGVDSVAQFLFYQPIVHRWRETDFYPCSVTCGGGYQLTSAECFDLRSNHVVVDQYCNYYPENVKPKPRLQECNLDPCPDSDGYKQIMPYDLYHPLPRWESSLWTACSASCGGGFQSRSVSCVEEDMQGNITPTDEWKCLYASKTSILQQCNMFDCPKWITQEWSPCTVTCGQGLRYRVVLCIDHRGLHAGGCNPIEKPHIKEECLVPIPCYKPVEELPVEAKPPWYKQAIELEEDVVLSEEPTFIRGTWGPCSKTCGAGTQRRTVKCQVLLSFSQAVADLPDDECEEKKPIEMQPCYLTPCPKVMSTQDTGGGPSSATERETLYDWEYDGFTQCSHTCGGGMKEIVVICLNKQTAEATDENKCVSAQQPPQIIKACNTEPCPPRWEVEAWSSCSATCGVGLQTRAVTCMVKKSLQSNYTEKVKEEECQLPKPLSVQACNRFDCPPMWHEQQWTQCSQTCGGGSQKRDIICKQRMADGSVLELPETFCPSPSLLTVQMCGQIDCPAQWIFTDWTQCSATCGEGTQRLLVVCKKLKKNGQFLTLIPEACASVIKPSTTRACSAGPCERISSQVDPDPAILTQRKVYIQLRKGTKKLHFDVGGYAYLLPWTSIVLRCPTHHFNKGLVHWLKDGKPVILLPHVSISHVGNIKIQQVRNSDVGIYTCVAGLVQESFVLKLIGNKQKVSVPEFDFWVTDISMSPKNFQTSSAKVKATAVLNRYDNIVQCLLQMKGLSLESHVPNKLLEEDTISDSQAPQVLVADLLKIDEVTRNLSNGLQGLEKNELIAQLLEELTKNAVENNESTLELHGKQEYIHPRADLRKASHSIKQWEGLKSPVIIQTSSKVYKSPQELVSYRGSLVLVPKQAIKVELKCEVKGNPQPIIVWTKARTVLKNSSRVGLMPDGSLTIEVPRETDYGLYTCQAINSVGSTSLSFQLYKTESVCKQGNNSSCSDNFQSTPSCYGEHCRHRWLVSLWSPCSASCGGGLQRRDVICLGTSEETKPCMSAGRRPAETKTCNKRPCTSWMTMPWGPCLGRCVGPRRALQHRHVFCQDKNRARVATQMCNGQPRPISHRNCTTEACALQWRIGPWTQCTATCGRHGFQSRHVACVHRHTGKPDREFHCAWKPRPASWQRCNIRPCGKGECQDSTRYCENVRQLDLCPLPQFKSRCCRSCRNT